MENEEFDLESFGILPYEKRDTLSFKDFLAYFLPVTLSEDEKDDNFFEMFDWARREVSVKFPDYDNEKERLYIPSVSCQKYVESFIPKWLETQKNASGFVENLFEISPRHLGSKASVQILRETFPTFEKFKRHSKLFKDSLFLVEELQKQEWNSKEYNKLLIKIDKKVKAWWDKTGGRTWTTTSFIGDYLNGISHQEFSTTPSDVGFALFRLCDKQPQEKLCNLIRAELPTFNFENLIHWKYFGANEKYETNR
jgi:hypothetical protein